MKAVWVGALFVFAALVTGLAAASLLTDPEHARPPHAQAEKSLGNFGVSDPAVQGWETEQMVAVIAWVDGVNRAAWEEGVREAERLANLARERATSSDARGSVPRDTGTCGGDLYCFLACTRAHESDTAGGYGAVSPGGQYRGAYQFQQQTGAGAVTRAGYPEYADVPAHQWPQHVQDAAAAQLYSERGNQPWGGRC